MYHFLYSLYLNPETFPALQRSTPKSSDKLPKGSPSVPHSLTSVHDVKHISSTQKGHSYSTPKISQFHTKTKFFCFRCWTVGFWGWTEGFLVLNWGVCCTGGFLCRTAMKNTSKNFGWFRIYLKIKTDFSYCLSWSLIDKI